MNQLNVQTNNGACSCGCGASHEKHSSQMKAVKRTLHNHDHLKKGVDCGCGHIHQEGGSKEELSYEGCCGERKDNVRNPEESHDSDDDEDHHHGDSCGCALEIDHEHGDGCGCSSGDSHEHEHGSGCGCGGDCVEADFKSKPFIAGIIGFVIGEALDIFQPGIPYAPYVTFAVFLIAYLLVGYKVLATAGKNILKGKVFDENFLMSIASIGAFCIGQYPEGVAVMLFYQVGEYFQGKAVSKSRKSISELMDIRPDKANLMIDGKLTPVPAETVKTDSLIAVRPGEKVPLDGIIEEGSSDMDTKALTGESIPRDVEAGDEVLSGFVNGSGLLMIRVTKEFSQSTVAKILQLVEHASEKKSKTENFITKFARYYTPAIVVIAVGLALIPPFLLSMGEFSDWLYRALVFLVVSCPCALVISIPLGFFGGIGAASKQGILIKGSSYLEALNNVDTVIFDKTGTLTDGVFQVKEVYAEDDFGRDKVLQYTGAAESHSTHPIAVSIKEACKAGGINRLPVTENMQERPGFGIKCRIEGKEVLVGSARLLKEEGVKTSIDADAAGTVVYLAVEGVCKGAVLIADQIKEDSVNAISELTGAGIQTVMLTGDRKEIAASIGEELGIGRVVSELLPHEKVAALEKIDEEKKRSGKKGAAIFVGDGINDAPVLARADIGIAMGGAGSDAAIEAADAVIMDDNPKSVATALKIAGKTRTIVWQNIALALGVKAVVLMLGAFGFATMWEAVFADVGVAILAVLNATRAGGGLK